MTVLTHYLGDKLVWTFANDEDRDVYRSSRRWPGYNVVMMCILAPLTVTLTIITILGSRNGFVAPILLGIEFLRQFHFWRLDNKAGLDRLELLLSPSMFMIVERFREPRLLNSRHLGVFKPKHVRSAQWVSDGCLFTMNRWHASVKQVLLHNGLFSSQSAIATLYRWAEEHKITIDGVPPLPGGYVRPIEERRGL